MARVAAAWAVLTLAGALTSAPSFGGTAGIAFEERTDWPAGRAPFWIDSGDFNGDGRPDLVTANHGSDDLSVLMGHPDGQFASGEPVPIGRTGPLGPIEVRVADLNGDGQDDLLVSNELAATLTVLPGRGAARFDAGVVIETSSPPGGLALGDLDRDGRLDVILALPLELHLQVRIGTADGFGEPRAVMVPGPPSRIAVGDLDGDGVPDLAVTSGTDDRLFILTGTGSASFLPPRSIDLPAFSLPNAVVIEDIDRDGRADIAVANEGDDSVILLAGQGNGVFSRRRFDVAAGPVALAVADLDGDGIVEMITASRLASRVSVLAGRGSGDFASFQEFRVDAAPSALVVEDFDRDGLPDLATSNTDGNDVSVLLNRSGTASGCAGDCDQNRQVSIDELVRAVNIALGSGPLESCRAADSDGGGSVLVDDLIRAVNTALGGCPAP